MVELGEGIQVIWSLNQSKWLILQPIIIINLLFSNYSCSGNSIYIGIVTIYSIVITILINILMSQTKVKFLTVISQFDFNYRSKNLKFLFVWAKDFKKFDPFNYQHANKYCYFTSNKSQIY